MCNMSVLIAGFSLIILTLTAGGLFRSAMWRVQPLCSQ
jgi:hypothetical protein